MKRLFAAALLGALSLGGLADKARAATFQPSLTNTVDFGDVAIGQTRSIFWDISWLLEAGDVLLSMKTAGGGTTSLAFGLTRTTDGCNSEGGTCIFALSFTPTELGLQTAKRSVVRLDLEAGRERYLLKLQGTGIEAPVPQQDRLAAVPLPATLPMLVAGFGIMGLIRRRKPTA